MPSLFAISVGAGFDDAGGGRIAALADVSVTFRPGQLSAIVGPFFAAPPVVEHFELVSKS